MRNLGFWPPLLAHAGYGHAMILSIFFPPFPGPFVVIHFLNIYTCIIYKKSCSPGHSRNPEGFVSLLLISQADLLHLAPCPKEMIFLSYFPGSSLLLASFKTCLLIASEVWRQGQLHPPVPSLTFLGLVFMLLNLWQFETHYMHPSTSSKHFYSLSHHWTDWNYSLVYSEWKMSITFS